MNYQEAEAYINNLKYHTEIPSTIHARRCLELLGNPDRRIGQVIHIAGTNGKGSTSAFLTSVLREASFKTGTFTSPHLIRMNERIAVDGQAVSDEEFLEAFHPVCEAARFLEKNGGGDTCYFEFFFLLAMVHFAKIGTEAAVIETGLGGLKDTTNTLEKPALTVITSIGFDHMEYLGNTIPEIAAQKAGILKAGVPCVCDASDEEASRVILARANELGSAAFPLYKDDFTIRKAGGGWIDFSTFFRYDRHADFRIRTSAPYQAENAALSVLALKVLHEGNPAFSGVTGGHVKSGLEKMFWPARMEEIRPRVFLDGAHNGAGTVRFVEAARQIAGEKKAALVFGVMGSKDYGEMIRLLLKGMAWNKVYVTKVPDVRGADTGCVAELFRTEGMTEVDELPDFREAFLEALRAQKEEEYVFICGSLYLAGAVEEINKEMEISDDQF